MAGYANPSALVTTDWVAEHRTDDATVRWRLASTPPAMAMVSSPARSSGRCGATCSMIRSGSRTIRGDHATPQPLRYPPRYDRRPVR